MSVVLPFLTAYDPPGTSEGTLDPLGLYQIADQLAVQLVPAIRERMQRIRFLTAIAVGSFVTEEIEDDPKNRDASPYLVWEWLLVEALIRTRGDDDTLWGVPGTLVGKNALSQYNYIDARSYLKTPRIFGFHGVYKRLALHLGILDVHLRPGPNADLLKNAWAFGMRRKANALMDQWKKAIETSLKNKPPHTKSHWALTDWKELADAFPPLPIPKKEKSVLYELLHSTDNMKLGALPDIWKLQSEIPEDDYHEEWLHKRLKEQQPRYSHLIDTIQAYEQFARSLQDAFDILRAEAVRSDIHGFHVPDIIRDPDFINCIHDLDTQFEKTFMALGEIRNARLSLQNLFQQRFGEFAEPMDHGSIALALCAHHEKVQQDKSESGKRPWFDRLGANRIYIRHAYRNQREEIKPDQYVHTYRGWPIRRFYKDLT